MCERTQGSCKRGLLLHYMPRGLVYSQWRAKGEQTLLSVTQSFAVASWVASKHCSLLHLVRRGEQTTRRGEL